MSRRVPFVILLCAVVFLAGDAALERSQARVGAPSALTLRGNGRWLLLTAAALRPQQTIPSGSGGAVSSVFGRTGTVTAQTGDYTCSQVTGCTAGSGCVPSGMAGQILKDSGSGACSDALATDNGTTLAYTGTGGLVAPLFTANGSGAGALVLTQGTAQGHATANTITLEAPSSVTSYELELPASASTGIFRLSNSSNVVAASVSELSGDATTSGSNVVTVSKINGTSFSGTSGDLVSFGASNTPADSGLLASRALVNGSATNAALANGHIRRTLGYAFGDPAAASSLSGTLVGYIVAPTACTISGWDILVDAGTDTVQTWKVATSTAIPTSGNSISTSGVSLSSGTAIHSTTLTDFTSTSVAANDIIGFNIGTTSGTKYLYFDLQCDQ